MTVVVDSLSSAELLEAQATGPCIVCAPRVMWKVASVQTARTHRSPSLSPPPHTHLAIYALESFCLVALPPHSHSAISFDTVPDACHAAVCGRTGMCDSHNRWYKRVARLSAGPPALATGQ